jgi:5'-nucleotidase
LKHFEAYRVNGTPADCVALGAYNWERVDLVLSGINLGSNLGNSIWHSGTLAAAKQAALLGLRGIAFSTPSVRSEPGIEGPEAATVVRDEPKFQALAPLVAEALDVLLMEPDLKLVNVNIPEGAKGLMWTRQSCRQYDGKVVPGEDPMGRRHYWFTVIPIEESEEGTDRWAVENGWVSITPLRLDLTNERQLAETTARYLGARPKRAN